MYLEKPDYEKVKSYLVRYREFPSVIVIEPTTYCNLRCIICPYPTLKRKKGEMEFSTFKKIADEIAKENPSADLWFAFMGEPLSMGNKLTEMISYAKSVGIKNIHLNTNAMFMDKEMSRKIIDSGVSEVIVSLDGITKKTYESIRVGGNFETVMENLEYLLKLKNELNSESPEVFCQFIVMDENENEVEEFKKHWLNLGACVKIRAKLGWGAAIETDIFGLKEEERFPCPWTNRGMTILWDGRYAQCDADYEGKFCPSDINSQTIKEVWNGEFFNRRERHWNQDFGHDLCKNCKDWQSGAALRLCPNEGGK